MSRHNLDPLNPTHEVVVGWDRPLDTFFAQMIDTTADDESDAREVLWIGTDLCEAPDPAAVLAAVAPFAFVPPDLLDQLARDRRADE